MIDANNEAFTISGGKKKETDTVSHAPGDICGRFGGWAALLNYKAPICMIHLYRWKVSRVTGGVGSVIILC